MGNALHKLGVKMFQLRWWVVALWAVILVGAGVAAYNLSGSTTSTISIPGTQAQKTLDRFKELFPGSGSVTASVVVAAPEGKTLDDFRSEVAQLTADVSTATRVTGAISPFDNPKGLSEDRTIGYITVSAEDEKGTASLETINAVNEKMEVARQTGLTVEAGGSLHKKELGEILGVSEITGVLFALVVLVVALASLVAAGLPIITALVTVGISAGSLFTLSGFMELSSTAPVLSIMLGLAVGIDYSLFIINRYRVYVKEGYELQEAAGKAIATAGNAVLFAATTVVIALAALAVVQVPFMTVMGVAAAATVALAALVAVTLMPAFFGIVKLRMFGRRERKKIVQLEAAHKIQHQKMNHRTLWYRVGEALLKYRKIALAVSLLIIAGLAWPATHLQLGLPSDETAAETTSARKSFELLKQGFGVGYNGPLLVVVENLPAATDADKAAVRQQLTDTYMAQVKAGTATMPKTAAEQQAAAQLLEQQVARYTPYYQLQKVATRIAGAPGVQTAQAALVSDNGIDGAIQVIPTTGPSEEATKDLVAYLRNSDNQATLLQHDGASLAVTGYTAMQIDINEKLADALPVYLAVVVGLSLVLLMIGFRSILIPLKATLGFLLSVAAMFGALVAVFQWGWFGITDAPGPILSFTPILATGILFGLAMDYEFFLVSGMQEAYHEGREPKKAVLRGFALGSRVVVAAGIIMVSVFAGFVGNHDTSIQSIGFAMAIGILVDAFIVRMVIVPIVMSYLGKAAWWLPKWLDKRLPKVSVEGGE